MPELPEVETVARSLERRLNGRKILDISNEWPNHLATHDLDTMRDRISGTTVEGISRRGKYIVFALNSGDSMIIHLKMTGQLLIQPCSTPVPDHVHTVFLLSGSEELRFRDVRKFGRVYLTANSDEILGNLGPEPLTESFTPDLLYKMLAKRRRIMKPLLLDQEFIAGIGNIYADESLFKAKLAPKRTSNMISRSESDLLHRSIQTTLQSAIENGGATINDYRQPDGSEGEMQNSLRVYGREGEPCFRCDGVVERIVLGSRSTYFCPSCQV
jgi:formamidopyrimidine-DNA glycosylase